MSLINDGLKRAKQAQAKRPAAPASGAKLQPVAGLERRPSSLAWVAPVVIVLLLCAGSWMIWRAWKGKAPPRVEVARTTFSATAPVTTTPATVSVPKKVEVSAEVAKPKLNINTNFVTRVVPTPEAKPVTLAETAAKPPVEPVPGPSPVVPATAPPAAVVTPPPAVTSTSPVAPSVSAPPTVTGTTPPEAVRPSPAPPVATPAARSPGDFPALKLQGIFFRRTHPSVLINSRTLFIGDEILEAKVLKIERQSVTVEWQGQTKTIYLQ